MDKINNEVLLELIKKMKEEKTLESQNIVVGEVLKSKFLCPVILEQAPAGGGKIEITKDTKIQFSIIKTTDNKTFLIAFTGDNEVQKWQKGKVQQSIIYTFEDYAKIILNNANIDGFIIDPKGCNIVFTEGMIKEIRSNITRESVVEKDTQVELGIPSQYPEELVSKLIDVLKSIPDVKKGYLLLMKKNEEMSFLVVIDGEGDVKEHFSTIASASIPFLKGMSLNLVPGNTEFGMKVMQDFKPFYSVEQE